MPFIYQIIIMIILMVVSYALMPKPKMNNAAAKPAELNVPTVSPGRPMPVLFGRVTLQDPNVLWHGGKVANAIRK